MASPLLKGGRTAGGIEVLDPPAPGSAAVEKGAPKPQATSLLLDGPVRSGQTVAFPNGDVSVIGSVASGAEIVAGGSIHVYGKIEAELLAIDGLYKTADDIEADLRGRPIQAWLDGDTIRVVALD